MKRKKGKSISMRVSDDLYKKLQEYAEAYNSTMSWVARTTLEFGVDVVMTSWKEAWEIRLEQLKRDGKI